MARIVGQNLSDCKPAGQKVNPKGDGVLLYGMPQNRCVKVYEGNKLQINVDASEGLVRVELLDA